MIVTILCDFCGWANDNNFGPCHKCGGHVEEKRVRGKYKTVIVKKPDIPMPHGYYNQDLKP